MYDEYSWVDEIFDCIFLGLLITGIVFLALFLAGAGPWAGPTNHDPKKGDVRVGDLWEWCNGPDMFYQPDSGFSHPVTIRVNSPECR